MTPRLHTAALLGWLREVSRALIWEDVAERRAIVVQTDNGRSSRPSNRLRIASQMSDLSLY